MRTIFNDPSIENDFRKKGFVVVPFLSSSEAEDLKIELLKLKPSDNYKGNQETAFGKQSFHMTFFDSDTDYKKTIYALAKKYFDPAATHFLKDYKCVQGNVFLKAPGTSLVYPHQNLTIADEECFNTLSFWMPLQDTTAENGGVCLIPGSQNYFLKYRNTHLFWPHIPFFIDGKGLNYFIPISVKAGQLLILDDRMMHYTPSNKSDSDRWVLHSLWAPHEATLRFCDPKEKEVDIYNVSDDFWQFHIPGILLSNLKPDLTLPYEEKKYTEEELLLLLEDLKKQF